MLTFKCMITTSHVKKLRVLAPKSHSSHHHVQMVEDTNWPCPFEEAAGALVAPPSTTSGARATETESSRPTDMETAYSVGCELWLGPGYEVVAIVHNAEVRGGCHRP